MLRSMSADADAVIKADGQKPFFGHYSTANMIIAWKTIFVYRKNKPYSRAEKEIPKKSVEKRGNSCWYLYIIRKERIKKEGKTGLPKDKKHSRKFFQKFLIFILDIGRGKCYTSKARWTRGAEFGAKGLWELNSDEAKKARSRKRSKVLKNSERKLREKLSKRAKKLA